MLAILQQEELSDSRNRQAAPRNEGQNEITRAEFAAEITSHTQRKTDRAKASHHELN
jgi:hypothetical protein